MRYLLDYVIQPLPGDRRAGAVQTSELAVQIDAHVSLAMRAIRDRRARADQNLLQHFIYLRKFLLAYGLSTAACQLPVEDADERTQIRIERYDEGVALAHA